MGIYLGNLSVDEIERRTEVAFPQKLKDFMGSCRQNSASNIGKGEWHCFDIPFILVCGDIETATQIYNQLQGLSSSFKEPLQISIQGKS